ncbi:hypothetical protein ACJ2A9_14035 [Anaerobacillus sp. MEB173]|uniref:hypothetical protein n=1 Tax=Anaerobacillus sp. MEB173 TaxID=3383345 RepID=UPI003F91DD03
MTTELLEDVLHKLNQVEENINEMKAVAVSVDDFKVVKEMVSSISEQLEAELGQDQKFNDDVLSAIFD